MISTHLANLGNYTPGTEIYRRLLIHLSPGEIRQMSEDQTARLATIALEEPSPYIHVSTLPDSAELRRRALRLD